MCFGPIPSFASGAILTAAGTATLKSTRSKNERLFAAFPLVFGLQQFIEGLVWLAVRGGPLQDWLKPLSAAFLFFAYIFWPVFSPLAIFLLEPKKKHKWILSAFILAGIGTAIYLLWFFFEHDHNVTVIRHSIQYHIKKFSTTTGIFYLGSTYLPYLFSSYRGVQILGVLNIIFAAIARYMYWKTFDSVWCFFAAILSIGIFFFFYLLHRKKTQAAI